MNTPSLIRGLRKNASRFHRQERGATMTEFIICLPIFVIVFSGLGALFNLGKVSVATRTQAYQVWLENVKEQEENMGRITPRYAASDVLSGGAFDSLGEGDLLSILELADGASTFAGGHWGESYGRARLYGVLGGLPGTGTGNHALQEMKNLSDKPSGGQWTSFTASGVIGDAQLARYVVDDGIDLESLGSSSDLAAIAGFVISLLGGPQGLLAGTRYGTVTHEMTQVEKSTSVWGQTFAFEASYTSLLSPQPVEPLVDDMPEVVTTLTGLTLNAEQIQWLYVYATAQTIENYRVLANLFTQDVDPDFEYEVEKYPKSSRPAYNYNDWP